MVADPKFLADPKFTIPLKGTIGVGVKFLSEAQNCILGIITNNAFY